MDLAALQQALLRNQQATQQLPAMDEQFAQAQVLRDSPAPQINQYGTVSPFSIIANTINKSRGRKDIREVGARREAARGTVADTDAALKGNTLKMAMDKAALDESNVNSQIESRSALNKTREAEEKRKAAESKNWKSKKGELYTNIKGDKIDVYLNEKGMPVDDRGEPIPQGFYPVESSSGGRTAFKAPRSKYLKDLTGTANTINKFNEYVLQPFKPEYIQPTGVGTEILNKTLIGASRADLLKYAASPDFDEQAQQSAMWWANLKMIYELPLRHEIFGATLTNNEMSEWKDAINLLKGMPPEMARQRVNQLYDQLRDDLASYVTVQRKSTPDNGDYGHLYDTYDHIMGIAGGGYDPEKGLYSYGERTDPVANPDVSTPTAAPPVQPVPLSPEVATKYGEIVQGMDATDRAAFDGLTPMEKRLVLDDLYNSRNTMNE